MLGSMGRDNEGREGIRGRGRKQGREVVEREAMEGREGREGDNSHPTLFVKMFFYS